MRLKLGRPDLAAYRRFCDVPAASKATELSVTWAGVTTLLIDDGKESMLFAPHGLTIDQGHRSHVDKAPPCKLLISPFNRYKLPSLLGGTVTPGLEGLEHLIEAVDPQVVVQTHDELKEGKGLIPALASIRVFHPEDAKKLPWLAKRFMDIRDYQPVVI